VPRFDQLVGIDELHSELLGELMANGCLSRGHETREYEVVLRTHRPQN
jgi:hypothetical protein